MFKNGREKCRSFGLLLNCLLRQKRRNVFGGFAQDDRVFFFIEICGDGFGQRARSRLRGFFFCAGAVVFFATDFVGREEAAGFGVRVTSGFVALGVSSGGKGSPWAQTAPSWKNSF